MGVIPTSAAKTLLAQSSQANMRTTGLGISASADAILDDANNGAILTTLGISAFAQTLLDDADAAAARSTVGAGVGYVFEAKSADFIAADGKSYDVNAGGGAIVVTLPAAGAGKKVRIKKTGANTVTVNRAGSDTIDGATSHVINVAGENWEYEVDNTGTNWAIFG